MTGPPFFLPWEPSPTVIAAILLAAILFARGCRRVRVDCWRRAEFWTGLALLYATLQTQLDYYAEHEFFLHRVQHALLHHMGPFLIGLSAPGPVLAAGLPARVRPLLRAVRPIAGILTHPAVATVLLGAIFLLWLMPGPQFVAMLDWRWYRAMNWSTAATGILFWTVALDPSSRYSPFARIAMMLAILPMQIALGALLCLAGHDLYPIFTLCGRAFGGLSPLADQALGGVVIWLDGVMMSVLGVLIVVRRDVLKPGGSIRCPESTRST